jgi:hypothetical protein
MVMQQMEQQNRPNNALPETKATLLSKNGEVERLRLL